MSATVQHEQCPLQNLSCLVLTAAITVCGQKRAALPLNCSKTNHTHAYLYAHRHVHIDGRNIFLQKDGEKVVLDQAGYRPAVQTVQSSTAAFHEQDRFHIIT